MPLVNLLNRFSKFQIRCKGTTKIWNTQDFYWKNQIYLSFYVKRHVIRTNVR